MCEGSLGCSPSPCEANHTFPWLNLSEHHHFYQHDGGFRPTECAQIATSKTNMPFLLAGGNGKTFRTGRWIKYAGLPHKRLLTSIFNLFGDTRTSFGDSGIESSPVTTPGLA